MFIVNSYTLAIIFCFITMICWGSWGNTQKLASKNWRYELYYWDYTIGILLFALLLVFTLGSFGDSGRGFLEDIRQVDTRYIVSALIGGIIFNASNILLSASVSIAGMAVAFPLGVGLALVLGVFINYFSTPKGDPFWLFTGVILIVIAIICNGIAAGRQQKKGNNNSKKGIILAAIAGILMSFFYRFVAASMDLDNFAEPALGKLTPYTAVFIFSLGVFVSNFLFNTIAMKRPVEGEPVSISGYFKGNTKTHLVGILGGVIWCIGQSFSMIASEKAGAAISYGLGQGATLVSALWGILIWHEFRRAPRSSDFLNAGMFVLFVIGLGFLIYAGA